MSERVPVFAVVGRVNKGKSSIVSTFTEDKSVSIDRSPGTTTTCQEFEVRTDGRTLCRIVDTPGFEDAPRALAWLQRRETSAAERPALVAQFVEHFDSKGEFKDECKLLKPILAGAHILYVVDASVPYRPNYEAEMEILRWTGRPRMALINRIGPGDHSGEWRRALDQYFSIVRPFDAHRSRFADRIGLLRAFRELGEEGRAEIDAAITVLEEEWADRRRRAAGIVVDLIVEALSYVEEWQLGDDEAPETRRGEAEGRFHDALRNLERDERVALEALYRHEHLQREERGLDDAAVGGDLFAETSWSVLGLDTWQLVRAGVIGGAAVGGTIDAATGGTTFLLGTLVGGVLGGVSSYFGGRTVGDMRVLGQRLGGRRARIGPLTDANFPWILLDRALLHYASVVQRPHAKRDVLVIDHDSTRRGIAASLPAQAQSKISAGFAKLQRAASREVAAADDVRQGLEREIEALLEQLESAERDETAAGATQESKR